MVYLYRRHIGLSKSLYNKIFDDVKLMTELFSFLNSVHMVNLSIITFSVKTQV